MLLDACVDLSYLRYRDRTPSFAPTDAPSHTDVLDGVADSFPDLGCCSFTVLSCSHYCVILQTLV